MSYPAKKRLPVIFVAFVCICLCLLIGISKNRGNTTQVKTQIEPQVTLKLLHYQTESLSAFTDVIRSFEITHPNIKVQADLSGGDKYEILLRAKFSSNENLDIVGVHPGKNYAITYAQAGYLKDLTNSPFLNDIDFGALNMGCYNDKYYGLPIDMSYIVCFYNKRIFNENGIAIPTTWNEFISDCKKLKAKSITPISLGIKDLWISQLIPYALSATTIYKYNIDFDKQMYRKEKRFTGSEWQKTMEMCLSLMPYFNANPLGTSYDQQLQLFSHEECAMMVMGTWGIRMILDLNPKLDFGVFTLPASDDGENWACGAVGGMLGISASSQNEKAAKEFFSYFMSDKIYAEYLKNSMNLSVKKNCDISYNPIAMEIKPQIGHIYNFLDQNWPTGVNEVLIKSIQEMFAGRPIKDALSEVDIEWDSKR